MRRTENLANKSGTIKALSLNHSRWSVVEGPLSKERRSSEARRRRASLLVINIEEELKTVGRDILACAQPNRHETFTAHWSPYRRVSSRGRRAQIRFGRGARGEKPETTVRHFGFTDKVYGLPCTVRTLCYGGSAIIEMPSWELT